MSSAGVDRRPINALTKIAFQLLLYQSILDLFTRRLSGGGPSRAVLPTSGPPCFAPLRKIITPRAHSIRLRPLRALRCRLGGVAPIATTEPNDHPQPGSIVLCINGNPVQLR